MDLDLTRTSPELMIKRINEDNGLTGDAALKLSEVSMDLPFEVPPDSEGRDISVLLLSVPQVKYRGEQTVYAKRIDSAEYFANTYTDPVRLKVMDAVTTRDLITRLNSLYHLAILPNEVEDNPIDWSQWEEIGGGVPHVIVFKESYVFRGTLTVLIGDEYAQFDIQTEPGAPVLLENGQVMTFDTIL